MATIAENIQTLRSIKSDIKNAIIQKGGSVTDAFGTYAQAITNLPSGGGGGTENEDALVTRTLSVYSNDRVSVVGNYAFYFDNILQSIDLQNCISIGLNAFYHCSALQSVRLPLCEFINNSAFTYCSILPSIDLPNCSYIGNSAFEYCSTLSFVNAPNCKYIDNAAFGDCKNLISIDLPSCINLKDNVFRYCTKLNYISLPLCQYISNAVFFVCDNLFSIYLPNCISMGNYVFATCSNISIIKIPICQYLGSAPFRACSKIKEIYLNSVSSVTSIQSTTFSECPNLTSVYVPSSLVDAFKTAQYWSSISSKIVAYREPTEPTKYPPLVYSAKSAGSTITVNGQSMTLEQGDNITLDYPNEITSVEATDNEELTYLQIPNTVTSINDNAFDGCVALTSITLPDSLTSIGVGAFQTCIGLTSINIPSGVTSISMETFNGCSALASVTLPEGLTNIGSSTFMDCTSLTSITIPSTVTMIDFEAFNYCEALTDFNFNGTKAQWRAITLGDDWNLNAAFTVVHCTDGDVSLEEPIQPIQPNKLVYSAKPAGSTITVNGQSMTLEQGENIVLDYPNEITSVKATDNTALTAITIPNTMTGINGSAFKNCYYLTNINIPNTITDIYTQAFRSCLGLTSITIPENVKNIYDFAFMGCTKLSDFNYNGTTSQWASITKGTDWNYNSAFTVVHCTDGDVNIL